MSRGFDYDDFHDADDDEYFFDDQGDLLHYDNDGIVRQDNTDNLITFVRQGLENRSSMVSDATIISTLKKKNDDPEAAIEHIIRTILDADLLESMSKSIMDILGPDAKYTTKLAIQDSLYYYYYDEQKTLDYIKKQVLTTKNKDLAEGELPPPLMFSLKQSRNSTYFASGNTDCGLQTSQLVDMSTVFHDMPWLSVPPERMTTFISPVPVGPQGLLGGSKLQALAARRKKQAVTTTTTTCTEEESPSIITSTLSESLVREKLAQASLSDCSSTGVFDHPHLPDDSSAKRVTLVDAQQPPAKRLYKASRLDSTRIVSAVNEPVPHSSLPEQSSDPSNVEPAIVSLVSPVTIISPPSAFAQTLFGPPPNTAVLPQTFPLPYVSSSQFVREVFAQPSPDDIVLAAQAKAIKREKALQREAASEVASSIGESTEDGPVKMKGFKKPQSNKLNVIELYNHRASHEKRDCSFVVAGHVDAGKSTLMGRLLLEVGAIDDYSVSKNEAAASKLGKKTFGFAWVMDQREEERERGVTIDIATNHFETEKTKFTILDAPGHKDFVPNMISGASQADFAVLVIDANTNAFERGLKGQTLEHILLLRSLGIQRIVIAVNKLDMVGWSRERYEEIRDQVTAFMLKLSFPKRMISFVPISGLDGTNISKKATHNSSLDWYEGPTLLETLEAIEAPAKVLGRPMRMAISETFNSAFGGLTISGRLQVGTVQVGDELVVASLKSPLCYVKSILVGQEPRDWAVSGEHVDLVVVGIEPEDIQPGDVISISTFPVELSNSFSLKVLAFKPFMADTIDLHRGRKHSAGCVTAIPALLDKASGVAKSFNPSVVSEGAVARVTVVLRNDIAVDPGQRVVIRKDGETIAAGVVE